MYQVTNISGGQLVCTLADGKTTLRVDNKKSESVPDAQMTKHLFNLESKKLVKLVQTSVDPKTPKTTTAAATPAAETKEV